MNEPSWWQRNWKWFVPVGCGTLVLMFAIFVASVFFMATSMMTSSEAYAKAMAAVQAHPAVASALGEPIEVDGFVGGSIDTTPSSGKADLSIPVAGPRGKGTVYAVARKHTGEWTLRELVIELSTGERIDLLADAADQPRSAR